MTRPSDLSGSLSLDDRPARVSLVQVMVIWALTMGAYWAALPELLADPFIRHDDYAALRGRADVYYGSTLSEGRWLNYWWALRPVFFDHQAVFTAFLALWALAATLFSAVIFPNDRFPWRMALGALIVGFCPPMINIALWPGTLLPGMALVAGYAAILACGSLSARFWILPLFVIPALMSHGSFPLVMAVMALLAPGWVAGRRGGAQMIGFAALFGASLAIGTALIFSVNWSVHGVFGVKIDDWRGATPAQDLASAAEMVVRYINQLMVNLENMFHVTLPILSAVLVAAFIMLQSVDRGAAKRVFFALAIVMGVQAAQAVATGLLTPFRGQFPLWIVFAAMPLLALRAAGQAVARFAIIVVAAAFLTVGSWHWRLFETTFSPYQAATRAIAMDVAAVDPSRNATLFVRGDARELPNGEETQSSNALGYRLELLTGRDVVMCSLNPEDCATFEAQSGPPYHPAPEYVRTLEGGDLLIRLRDTPEGKVEDPTKWLK